MAKKVVKQKCEQCGVTFEYPGRKPNHLCLECSLKRSADIARRLHQAAEEARYARS